MLKREGVVAGSTATPLGWPHATPRGGQGYPRPPTALGQPMKDVKECGNPSICLTECTLVNWRMRKSAAKGTTMVTRTAQP